VLDEPSEEMLMVSSPYRVPARAGVDPAPARSRASLELTAVAVFAWVVTVARVVTGLVRVEPASRELDLAWLVLFLAPVVIWGELQGQRAPR
jgi:hypothetical protein